MSIKENNLEFVLKKTIADLVTDEVKADRAERFKELKKVFDDLGVDRFIVELPDGEKVAALSIMKPKPKLNINEDVLIGWLEANGYEDLIIEKEIPARVERYISKDFIEDIGLQQLEDGTFVTSDGVPVDGVEFVFPEPSSFTVRYEKGGQDRLVEAYKSGELAGISAGATLPQIELGEDE